MVALLGFVLRSKILFSLPFIDYKNLLSGHSHFAFGGWAALALVTLMVYDLLPAENRKIYQGILWGLQITAWGMALTFPFTGYAPLSIIFSTAHILVGYLFAFLFTRDAIRFIREKSIRWLSITGVVCLVLSSIGPFGLAYMMATNWGNANNHRDFIYTFLHFQYNGFFTLAALSLFASRLLAISTRVLPSIRRFSVILSLSILPTLFLSLLWHNLTSFYIISIAGCCLILAGLIYFGRIFFNTWKEEPFRNTIARSLFIISFLSLGLKMVLQIGPIFPGLGTAVYGDRPLIIGFLHLVFLAFLTLYLLASFLEDGYFNGNGKNIRPPFLVFVFGVVANELLLMLQGLGILFFYNTSIYNWLLWINSLVLVAGSAMIAVAQPARKGIGVSTP
jgi:hypothetical protein